MVLVPPLDHEVELAQLRVELGVVAARVGPAALPALDRAEEHALRIVDHRLEIERRVPARIELTSAVAAGADLRRPLLELLHLLEPGAEPRVVADDRGVARQRVLQFLVKQVRVLLAVLPQRLQRERDEIGDLTGRDRRLALASGNVGGGSVTGSLAEHDQIGERVASQPVGTVESAGDLSGREQAFDVGFAVLRLDPHPAHRVVDGGGHLHRLFGDVDVRQRVELLVHRGQLVEDVVAWAVGDVEEGAAMRGPTTLDDLLIDGAGDHVAGRELHPLGVVLLHEPFVFVVEEEAALAADSLRDQDAADPRGPDHPGGVELDHLAVHQQGAGVERHRRPVAGRLPGVRGDAVDLAETAGGEEDRPGVVDDQRPVVAPVPERALDAAVLDQEPGAGRLHVDGDPGLVDQVILERADQLQAGPVADVGEPGVGVAAEGTLVDQPFVVAVEDSAPALQLEHAFGRFLGVDLGHAPVVEQLAALHGVREVRLPAVRAGDVAERRRHPAFGHHRVGLAQEGLTDHQHVEPGLGGGDRAPHASPAGADHQDVGVDLFVVRLGCRHGARS